MVPYTTPPPIDSLTPTTILGGFIPVYGVLVMFGFLATFVWAYIEWNKKGYRTWDFIQVVTFSTFVSLYGAKIWYMIFDPVNAFSEVDSALNFFIMLLIPSYGRSIIGTVVCAPFAIWIWKKNWGPDLETWKLMDILLPAIFIGQACGRWGNFANHEVFGQAIYSEDALNWLPKWISDNMYITLNGETAYRTPLFLYESIADIVAFVLIILIFKTSNYWKAGTAGMSYLVFYGIIRSSMELFRDPEFIMSWGPIPTSFVTALFLIVIGLSILINLQWGKDIKRIIKKI